MKRQRSHSQLKDQENSLERTNNKKGGYKNTEGLYWWSSGKELTCQYRGHRSNPWSRKIPRAAGQLSLGATTREATSVGSPHYN